MGRPGHGELRTKIEAIRDELNPELEMESAITLCWSAMQGLVQLHPTLAAVAARHDGGQVPDIGDLAERLAHLIVAGLVTPPA